MAVATFNTTIYSSPTDGVNNIYILDDVITKDFNGPYLYSLDENSINNNFEITTGEEIEQAVLNVPSGFNDFEISVTVSQTPELKDPISEVATTIVTLSLPTFEDAKQYFFNSENVTTNFNIVKENWTDYTNTTIENGPKDTKK
jgi:hypothetical protein